MAGTSTNNTTVNRFETDVEGGTAYLEYHPGKNHIATIHTFVPESARRKGVAGELVEFMLDYVKHNHLKLYVYCPYVENYIERHPEHRSLVTRFYTTKKPL